MGIVTPANKVILSSGRFDGTNRAELQQAFRKFRTSPRNRVLAIHFHGGLVDQSAGEALAERLLPVYEDAEAYPLFVIWQAGLLETLRNNWYEIVTRDVFNLLLERVLQMVVGKLNQTPGEKGGSVEVPPVFEVQDEIIAKRAIGEEPFAARDAEAAALEDRLLEGEAEQLRQLIAQDARLHAATETLLASEPGQLAPDLEADVAQARDAREGDKALVTATAVVVAGVRIAARSFRRFVGRRDHGLYATVVEEVVRELKGGLFGGIVWKRMKEATADAFSGGADTHGGAAVLEEIEALWVAGHKPRVVLVGHSTGAVYICHMLRAAQYRTPEDIRFDVVFLAPACTFELLDVTLAEAGGRIASFRSFAMEDSLERQDAILPPVYLRSLLYLVSGLLEDEVDAPLVGMRRYHGGQRPFDAASSPVIARVLDTLGRLPNAWVWSRSSDGLGRNTMALRHGEFDDERSTLASLKYLIAKGFA